MPDHTEGGDALIQLRLPAATKARWVRESRAAGQRLTDWIVERVERQEKTAMTIATLSIIYTMTDGSYTSRRVPGVDASSWDAAVIRARDIVRDQARLGPVIAAEISTVNTDPHGAVLSKVYQPSEWA